MQQPRKFLALIFKYWNPTHQKITRKKNYHATQTYFYINNYIIFNKFRILRLKNIIKGIHTEQRTLTGASFPLLPNELMQWN